MLYCAAQLQQWTKVPRQLDAAAVKSNSVLCMPSFRINNSLTTLGHAVHKRAHVFSVERVPFRCDHVLQFVHGGAVELLDAARESVPEVLDRVQIRGIGREVDAAHSMIVQPGAHSVGGVVGAVVLQEVPLLDSRGSEREVQASRRKEIVVEDALVEVLVELVAEDVAVALTRCTETRPHVDFDRMRPFVHAVDRIERLPLGTTHPHTTTETIPMEAFLVAEENFAP
jgi:hypothetical protein